MNEKTRQAIESRIAYHAEEINRYKKCQTLLCDDEAGKRFKVLIMALEYETEFLKKLLSDAVMESGY